MNESASLRNRRSIRLKGYDYSQPGAYFVTLVAFERACIFGEIKDGQVVLSDIGRLVKAVWQALPFHFAIELGDWVVMPNHLHGILVLLGLSRSEMEGTESIGMKNRFSPPVLPSQALPVHPNGTQSGSLGAIIQNFKSMTTARSNRMWGCPGLPLWQRNYFEHIIRDDEDWDRIARYIVANPERWAEDQENPALVGSHHK